MRPFNYELFWVGTSMRIISKIILIAVGFILINYPFIEGKALYYLSIERPDRLIRHLLTALLALTILELFAFTRMRVRLPLFLLFLFGSMTYLIYYLSAGSEPDYEDFRTILDARVMIKDAAQGYQGAILEAILYHLPITIGFFLFPKIYMGWKGTTAAIALYIFALAGMLMIIYNKSGKGTNGRASYITPVAQMTAFTYLNYLRSDAASFTHYPRTAPTPADVQTPKAKNIIIVMDESIRGDMIDLNSHLGTTPSLLEYPQNQLLNFGMIASFSNCSDTSNLAVRKLPRLGKEPSDLFVDSTTIWDIAETAGFKPFIIDAQHNATGHNFYTDEELKNVTNIRGSQLKNDGEVIDIIAGILQDNRNETPVFIYAGLKGAHFPFQNTGFPTPFTPAMKNTVLADATPEEALNSYKNLVRANTDQFFIQLRALIADNPDTIVLYTSDHGQDLTNLRDKKTHCDAKTTSMEEGIVPMILFADESILQSDLVQQFHRNNGVTNQMIIAPMVMDFMGFSPEVTAHFTEYPALLNQSGSEIGFIYKRPIPHFRSEIERFDMTPEDLKFFQENGHSNKRLEYNFFAD